MTENKNNHTTKGEGEEKLVAFKLNLPVSLRGRFKAACAIEDSSMSQVLIEIIEVWTKQKEEERRR